MSIYRDPYKSHNIEEIRERLNVKISGLYGYHGGEEMNELRESYEFS